MADFAQISDSMSIEELASIPNEVLEEMLSEGADIGKRALEKQVVSQGLVDTGQLKNSMKKAKKKDKTGRPFFTVYPTGKRKTQSGERKTGKRQGNNDVGFIYEFGSPRRGIVARQWVRKAIEANADRVVAAELAVYDKFLQERET